MALETLDNTNIEWKVLASDYSKIRDLMSECLDGFEDYNLRVKQEGGFSLPNPPRDSRTFNTDTSLANFTVNKLPVVQVADGNSVLMTIRSHDQYNTTIYGLSDRYRGVKGNRRIIFMNALEMAERGWKTRQIVNLTSHFNGETRTSNNWQLVPYEIPKGNIAAYFPEANELVHLDSTAEESNTPTSKWIEVTIHEGKYISMEEE